MKKRIKNKSISKIGKIDNLQEQKIKGSYLNFDAVQYSSNRNYIIAPLYDDAKDELDSASRYRLLLISRHLENNFAVYKQLVDTVSRYSCGRGIMPAPATSNTTYNLAAEFAFYQWSDNRFCTVDGSGTYWDVLRLCTERLVVDGEFFCLFTKSKQGYPQLQLIDPLKVQNNVNDPANASSGTKIVDGITYNVNGTPISYKVKLDDGTFQPVSPENVVHVFDRKRIGQGRGFPWATAAFIEMQEVKDTLNLELQAAKVSSIFAGQLIDTVKVGQTMRWANLVHVTNNHYLKQ